MSLPEDIAAELRKINPKIRRATATVQAEAAIVRLRAEFQEREQEPNARAIRDRLKTEAKRTRTLANNIKKLPYNILEDWPAELIRRAEILDTLATTIRRDLPGQLGCVVAALNLICSLSPATEPADLPETAGSPFYQITRYLWRAASGNNQSCKRYCDAILKECKRRRQKIRFQNQVRNRP